MQSRVRLKLFLALALETALLLGTALAQEIKTQATVFPIDGKPICIEDFNLDGQHFYDAFREEGQTKLLLKDINTITFLKPGKFTIQSGKYRYEAEVTLNDGRTQMYRLQPPGNIVIESRTGIVSLSHSKVVKIEFGRPCREQAQAESQDSNLDLVLLKNGDTLRGHVQTKTFELRAPYGTLRLGTEQIGFVSFDARGKDIDLVVLKSGDILSGKVRRKAIRILLDSGKEINLDTKTIKKFTVSR